MRNPNVTLVRYFSFLCELNDGIELSLNGTKYAIFSDLHLGDKSNADNFEKNEKAFVRVLEYYKSENYQLILLGDIEELWQFDLTDIVKSYKQTIYKKFQYGATFGCGAQFWLAARNAIKLDYSFHSIGELGTVHCTTVGFTF